MTARVTFVPIGNADCCRIDLVGGRKVLIDFADTRDSQDPYDKRVDLAGEVRRDLDDANRDYLDVVCFTHLDSDHVKGSGEFFWFEHAASYQGSGRIKIRELWVPAAAVTEEGAEDDARVIRQEARYRLRQGKGIKVFSRPERLHDLLESWGLTVADRAPCIVDAGQTVPGFYKEGPDKAEFFVHSPFAWRLNDREVEDRNQDSIVMQVTFVEAGVETYGILGSDADYETLSKIVEITKWHKREHRLLWDFLKLFHHCSYLSLGPERGKDETEAVPEVKWLFETQSRDGCLIVSTSDPIPDKGTEADKSIQPPHRQAANHHRRVVKDKGGQFKVTMEIPSVQRPKLLVVEITAGGVSLLLAAPAAIGIATSRPARAG
jgi:beta-lactamase superfamily II metal-dependent hydrolase